MAKDLNDSSDNNEEEFLFSQEHESPEKTYADAGPVETTSASNNAPTSTSQRKKVILIIGIIAAVFCIYKLYGLFSSTSVRALKSPIPVAKFEETNAKPVTQTVQAAQSVSKLPDFSQAAPPGQEKEEMKSPKETSSANISSVSNGSVMMEGPGPEKNTTNKQQASSVEKSQENLQNQISGLSSAINEIQNNIAMLSQQVGQVVTAEKSGQKQESKDNPTVKTSSENTENSAKSVQHASANAAASEKPLHHKLTRTHPRRAMKYSSAKTNPAAYYYVRSMIQGRAWLLWGDNNTLTVSTGDVLPGYGKIEVIDTDNGVIKTSSGREIGYRPQDR